MFSGMFFLVSGLFLASCGAVCLRKYIYIFFPLTMEELLYYGQKRMIYYNNNYYNNNLKKLNAMIYPLPQIPVLTIEVKGNTNNSIEFLHCEIFSIRNIMCYPQLQGILLLTVSSLVAQIFQCCFRSP